MWRNEGSCDFARNSFLLICLAAGPNSKGIRHSERSNANQICLCSLHNLPLLQITFSYNQLTSLHFQPNLQLFQRFRNCLTILRKTWCLMVFEWTKWMNCNIVHWNKSEPCRQSLEERGCIRRKCDHHVEHPWKFDLFDLGIWWISFVFLSIMLNLWIR